MRRGKAAIPMRTDSEWAWLWGQDAPTTAAEDGGAA